MAEEKRERERLVAGAERKTEQREGAVRGGWMAGAEMVRPEIERIVAAGRKRSGWSTKREECWIIERREISISSSPVSEAGFRRCLAHA